MKVLLEIQDEKAGAVLELLKDLPYVKTTTISPAKALLIKEIKEAVEVMKLVRSGKKKTKNAEAFIRSL